MMYFLDFDRTLFDTERFYNALERGLIIPDDALSLDQLSSFLYADTLPFLKRHQDDTLVLVTRGERLIQETKVLNTLIEDFFDELLYVPEGSKGVAIEAYLNAHPEQAGVPMFFLDDTIAELESIRTHFPDTLTVVRMRRLTAKNAGEPASHLNEAYTLDEFEEKYVRKSA